MDTLSAPARPVRKLLVIADAMVIVGALALAVVERPVAERVFPLKALPSVVSSFPEYAIVAALSLPLWLALAARLELHSMFERAWSVAEVAWALIKLHALGFVVLATLIYATQVQVNRSLLGLFLANSFVLMLGYRVLLVLRRRAQHRRGLGRARLLLVGEPAGALGSFALAVKGADYPPDIVGYLDDRPDPPESDVPCDDDGPVHLGGLKRLGAVLHAEAVDFVLFFPPFDRADRIERELLACETVGVPALVAIDLETPTRAVPQLSRLFDRPFVTFDVAPKRADLLAVKHGIDLVLAGLGLLVLLPFLGLVAVAILVTMGRPVLFVQERSGYRGRPFRMLKFRTMVAEAEQQKAELLALNEVDGAAFKLTDDPRTTRLGRLLRKTSIDELPQLFNVLAGTMSLVGPRPLPLDEQQQLRGWHRRRLSVRPGITGLWQVSGRSELGFERWMQLDLQYVDNWSLWLDCRVLAKTVPVVLLQRGAR